jgi:hypothetical protein
VPEGRRAVLERRPLDLDMLLRAHIKLLERTLPESIEFRFDCEHSPGTQQRRYVNTR